MLKRLNLYSLSVMILLLLSLKTMAQNEVANRISPSDLQIGFQTPPDAIKPSVYWYWLSDNISTEGVTRDLEAMAKIGIGRAFIGNIGLPKEEMPYGNVKLFTDEWWQITEQAIRTASKVGVDIGMFNSPGWSQSGGPWIRPEKSMRYLATSELRFEGPKKIVQKLIAPTENYQNIALIAFPEPENDNLNISSFTPKISSQTQIDDLNKLVDGKRETETLFPPNIKPNTFIVLDIEVVKPFTARSLVLYPAEKPFSAEVELQVSDGDTYRTIKRFKFDRSNPRLQVGFIPYGPVSISFSAVQAKKFRLIFSDIKSKGGGLAEIEFSSAPRVERYIEKQLAKMFQTPLPLWNEYQWSVQPEPEDKSLTVDPSKVINITQYLSTDGTLNWNVPTGKWVVVRLGMAPTGVTNTPASPEGRGLEVDKMNKQALETHFNAFLGKVLDRMPAQDRKAFKFVIADSYETGSQNWTDGFAAEFRDKYGYDPLPWLSVLTGRIVGTASQSDRFLWDLRRLVADNVAYKYVGGLRELSNKHGLKLWLENYGHWGFPAEFLQYGGQSDEIGGEFWVEGELGSIELHAASSAAHIYGKTKVSAESFTAAGLTYARYPAMLKKRGDWSFTKGINDIVLHVFITQPYEDRNPGVNAWFGTEFNRKNTWFDQSRVFVDYLRRCMFMLQQGKAVGDVAYFIGEDAPKMTGTQDPELPAGYSFDYINAEVIKTRLAVKDGKLVLPDGMSYRILVLPQLETMRPELLRKIRDLVADGATIMGPAPKRSPSLQNYPAADQEVQKIAAELWGNVDGINVKAGKFGKGRVFSGIDMQSALTMLEVMPDFKLPGREPVLYTHRTTAEGDIYFVTNQSDQPLSISPTFRVSGKQPEFWDPVTGTIRNLPVFEQREGSTTVPLKLEAYQSGFIVFRKAAAQTLPAVAASNFPDTRIVSEITGPWDVTFDSTMRGTGKPVVFERLEDWTKRPEDNIKYYSGTAVYKNTFKAARPKVGEKMYLNLGDVKVMAKVKLNGADVGGVWTDPWRVDITEAVKSGENKLEIEVVNTWVNRLIGDSKLPAGERKTWTNVNPYGPNSELHSSGLMGPVTIQAVKY